MAKMKSKAKSILMNNVFNAAVSFFGKFGLVQFTVQGFRNHVGIHLPHVLQEFLKLMGYLGMIVAIPFFALGLSP